MGVEKQTKSNTETTEGSTDVDIQSLGDLDVARADRAMNALEFKYSENLEDSTREYLRAFPELDRHIEEFSMKFQGELESFANEAVGTPIETNARLLVDNYHQNFEETVASLISIIGPKNKNVVQRILTNKIVPNIRVGHIYGNAAGVCEYIGDRFVLTISPDSRMNATYEGLRATLIHEFAHAYAEAVQPETFTRNSRLNEGVTEYLATRVLKIGAQCYDLETALAKELALLNEHALMDWYTGGSNIDYYQHLLTDLSLVYPPQKATEIANKVINLSDDIAKREKEHKTKKLDFVASRLKSNPEDPDGYRRASTVLDSPQPYQVLLELTTPSMAGEIHDALDYMERFYRDDEEKYFRDLIVDIAWVYSSSSKGF